MEMDEKPCKAPGKLDPRRTRALPDRASSHRLLPLSSGEPVRPA